MPAIDIEIIEFRGLQIRTEKQVNEITMKMDAEIAENHIPGLSREVAFRLIGLIHNCFLFFKVSVW